jgi:hypothetical protein
MSFLAWLQDNAASADPAALIRAAGLDPDHYNVADSGQMEELRDWIGASGPAVPPEPPPAPQEPDQEVPQPVYGPPPGIDDSPPSPPIPRPVYGPPPGPRPGWIRRWFGR